MTKSQRNNVLPSVRFKPATVRIPPGRATAAGPGKKNQDLISCEHCVRMNCISLRIFQLKSKQGYLHVLTVLILILMPVFSVSFSFGTHLAIVFSPLSGWYFFHSRVYQAKLDLNAELFLTSEIPLFKVVLFTRC